MRHLVSKKILIISPEAWAHIPVSKHHYARTLATVGNRVFFLNPPSDHDSCVPDKSNPNLGIVDYRTARGINRLPRMLRDLANRMLIRRIRRLCKTNFDIVWSFDAFRFQNLRLWRAPLKIYHVVDVHVAPLERELIESADLVLSVSETISDRVRPTGKSVARINHGVASYFFSTAQPPPRTNGLAAGYVGNLDNWCIDRHTLLHIVRENPLVTFYFIGPYREHSPLVSQLLELANTRIVGRVPSEELPAWFAKMDLFFMCYDGTNVAVNSNHHKILEFLSTGKPVVINYTDEYKDTEGVVIMSQTNDQLPELFSSVCRDLSKYSTPELCRRRVDLAASNSYERQLERIDTLIEQIK